MLASLICGSVVRGSNRVAGAAVQYEFTHEDCISGRYVDAMPSNLLGGILRQRTATECAPGVGISSETSFDALWSARSRSTIELLSQEITSSAGYTFELWIQPDADTMASDTYRPIFTIGENSSTCGTAGTTSRVLTQEGQVLHWKQTEVGGAPNLEYGKEALSSTASTTQTHLALVDEADCGFSLYVNGVRVFGISGICFGLDSEFVVQLFTNCATAAASASSVWSGTIYLFAVYPRALDATEIQTNYAAKLTNSVPVVSDMVVAVQEDGEQGSHYFDPKWYLRKEAAAGLAKVNLAAVDVDDDPDYINYSADNDIVKVYIASLPPMNLAVLYTMDGTAITSVPAAVAKADDGNFSVRIRPAWNAHSTDSSTPFTNFTYYAVDGVTGTRSIDVATATVVVTSKNDPAVAYSWLNATVYAGRKSILPRLRGDAIESSDSVVRAYISRLPSRGKLYFANESEIGSKPITNLPLSLSVGSVVQLPYGSLYVAYEYSGAVAAADDNDVDDDDGDGDDKTIFTDSFGFRLLDDAGRGDLAVGVEGNYTVIVRTALDACFLAGCPDGASASAAAQSLFEDSRESKVKLFGYDYSDSREDIKFVIVSPPSHGTIYDPVTNTPLAAGDELETWSSYPYAAGVDVKYIPDNNYFNFPTTRYNGSFLGVSNDRIYFKALPANASRSSSASSQAAAIEVTVKNVNDAAKFINTTASALEVYAVSYSTDDNDDDMSFPTTLLVPGLEIRDVDHDADVVVVYVEAERGAVSLNEAGVSDVDFSGSLYGVCFKYSQWQCKGDGDGDSKMRFVGQPSDINRALRNLEYRCTEDGVTDTITLSVYDGDGTGTGCIDGSDLDKANCCSDRSDGCHVSSVTFSVEVKEYAIVAAYHAGSDCDDDGLNCLSDKETLLVLVGFLLCIICSCCACVRRFCCGRKQSDGDDGSPREAVQSGRRSCLMCVLCCCCDCLRCICCKKKAKQNEPTDPACEMRDAPNPMTAATVSHHGGDHGEKCQHKEEKKTCSRGKAPRKAPVVRQSVVDVLALAQLNHFAPLLLELGICESDDLAQCKDNELLATGMSMVEIRRLRRKLQCASDD